MDTYRINNHLGSEEGTCILNSPKLASMNQGGQYNSPSFYESVTSGQQLVVSEIRGYYNRKHKEGQERNQIQPEHFTHRIRVLKQLVMNLKTRLDEERTEKQYYKRKSMEFYKKVCMHDPTVLVQCQRSARATQLAAAATAANAATSPSAPKLSAAVSPILRSPNSPSSATIPSIFTPSALVSSTKKSDISLYITSLSTPHQSAKPSITSSYTSYQTTVPPITSPSAPRPTAVPSATGSSTPNQTAAPSVTRSPASRDTAVPAVTHLSAPHGQASRLAASLIFIDLTTEKTPPSSSSKCQKRKRTPEQESEEGFEMRKSILAKSFDWMEPKDRPNFQKRNPYQPEPASFGTDCDQDNHDLGQASQELPLAPSQAPALPPAPAKSPNSPTNKHSNPRTRGANTKKRGETAKGRRQNEARERVKTKKKQILNAATAENTPEEEAEDYEAMEEEEMKAEKGMEAEDVDKMAEELENWLDQSSSV